MPITASGARLLRARTGFVRRPINLPVKFRT
jgi:hypothetical protein